MLIDEHPDERRDTYGEVEDPGPRSPVPSLGATAPSTSYVY